MSVWAANGCCQACVTAVMEQRPGAAELRALLGPGLSRGLGQPRHHRSQGAARESGVGTARRILLLRATLACFHVGFLPWHDRFLQIHFLKVEWCQANHAKAASFPCVVLVDGGGYRFRMILNSSKALEGIFCLPGSS